MKLPSDYFLINCGISSFQEPQLLELELVSQKWVVALPFPLGELPAPSARRAGAARCMQVGAAFSCSLRDIED